MDNFAWTASAARLQGPGFALFQRELARFNHRRLEPGLPSAHWKHELESEARVLAAERNFVQSVRERIAPLARDIPTDVNAFIVWFERLRESGPGQGDPLFPWLERAASLEQMRWFVEQEVAGEAGFDDLLALTQVKMPEQAKLAPGVEADAVWAEEAVIRRAGGFVGEQFGQVVGQVAERLVGLRGVQQAEFRE